MCAKYRMSYRTSNAEFSFSWHKTWMTRIQNLKCFLAQYRYCTFVFSIIWTSKIPS